MDIRELRDKIMTFLVPVLVVSLVLGGIVWIAGTKYFWNTSTLTLRTDRERSVPIRIELRAQIIKREIPIPGLLHYAMTLLAGGKTVAKTYPVDFSLPWSKSLICRNECLIDAIPSGEASIFVSDSQVGTTRIDIVILPDTAGVIDLRPKIQTEYVSDTAKFKGPIMSATDANALPGGIVSANIFDSLVIVRSSQGEYCYDIRTKQLISLPDSLDTEKIALTETEGVYMLITRDQVYLYDRFGRAPLKQLDVYDIGDVQIKWVGKQTEFVYQKESIKLAGYWWPMKKEGKVYFTNGIKVFFIK